MTEEIITNAEHKEMYQTAKEWYETITHHIAQKICTNEGLVLDNVRNIMKREVKRMKSSFED